MLEKKVWLQLYLEIKNRDFVNEVYAVTKTNAMLPNMVDEVTGGDNISKLFATKYGDLYNSVAYNEKNMASLLQNIHNKVDDNVMTVKILVLLMMF